MWLHECREARRRARGPRPLSSRAPPTPAGDLGLCLGRHAGPRPGVWTSGCHGEQHPQRAGFRSQPRLKQMPKLPTALDTFADVSCHAGVPASTPPHTHTDFDEAGSPGPEHVLANARSELAPFRGFVVPMSAASAEGTGALPCMEMT